MVQRSQRIQQLHAPHQRLSSGRVEEVEADEVVYAEGFKEEDDGREVRSLDLGDGVGFKLVVEGPFGVETEALAGADSAGSTGSLIGGGSRALVDG
jgi:hypothetical protein